MDTQHEIQTALFRSCCSDAARDLGPAARTLPADLTTHFLTVADATAPVMELPAERGSLATAHHEAAHIAVALACGDAVDHVTIESGKYFAAARLSVDAPWRLSVALSLAGDIAGRWSKRWNIPLHPSEIEWTINAVRACGGGWCDVCRAVRDITVGLRHPPDEAIVAELRRIEVATTAFVQTPKNWAFVTRLASMLLERGTVTGAEITEAFGSYEFDLSPLNSLK